MTLAIVASIFTGTSAYQRHTALNSNLCALDTALVQTIDESLRGVTHAEVRKYRTEYRRGYKIDVRLEAKILAHAPCHIAHKTPPLVR